MRAESLEDVVAIIVAEDHVFGSISSMVAQPVVHEARYTLHWHFAALVEKGSALHFLRWQKP